MSRVPISPLRRQRRRSVKMTRIVLLISLIILLGRLIFVIPGAISEHKQQTASHSSRVKSHIVDLSPPSSAR